MVNLPMPYLAAGALAFVSLVSSPAARAGQAEPATAPGRFSVRAFGATGDGKHLDTAGIASAIKAAAAAGGGVVVFPPGTYLSGTFELLTNVSLDLEAGAVIQASANLADYGSLADYGFEKGWGLNSSGEGDKVGLIVARGAENIAIFGQGAIDGNGGEFFDFDTPHIGPDFDARFTRDERAFAESMHKTAGGPVQVKPAGRPGTLIILSRSRNIAIRDVTLRNAPNWTLHLASSSQAVVTGIHIANDLRIPNNDGVDCIGCRNVHFSDCDISAGDDDFAFASSRDVTVVNSSLTSNSSGIRLEDTRFATFSDLTIHANRGIGIYERGGGVTSGILFSNLVIETTLLDGHWWGKGEPIYIVAGGAGNASQGVRNVRFSNILADGQGGVVIYGTKDSPVRDIEFDRVRLRIHAPRESVSAAVGGNFDLRWTATSFAEAVFAHDIPAVYCRYLSGWRVRGLEIDWDKNLPTYFTNGILCEDFEGIDIDDFSGRQAPESSSAVIALRRGGGISVRNSSALAGASTFLSVSEVSGKGLFVDNDIAAAARAFDPNEAGFTLWGNRLPAPPAPKPR